MRGYATTLLRNAHSIRVDIHSCARLVSSKTIIYSKSRTAPQKIAFAGMDHFMTWYGGLACVRTVHRLTAIAKRLKKTMLLKKSESNSCADGAG